MFDIKQCNCKLKIVMSQQNQIDTVSIVFENNWMEPRLNKRVKTYGFDGSFRMSLSPLDMKRDSIYLLCF